MADFSFTVDTSPMAMEMKNVSTNVAKVSGAVVAMQTAVIAAEQEAANHVCDNVNKGFYALMHSQLSQKIAQLTSTVEAKLLELGQYASALKSIQARMQDDYNMISRRYTKLFESINATLESRIAELDKPAFLLADRDMKQVESRMNLNSGKFATGQLESVLISQMLASSKVKHNAGIAVRAMKDYVKSARVQAIKTESSMRDMSIDKPQDIFLPVAVVETKTNTRASETTCCVSKSGNAIVDKELADTLQMLAKASAITGEWSEIGDKEWENIKSEFQILVDASDLPEVLKKKIETLFAGSSKLQILKQ